LWSLAGNSYLGLGQYKDANVAYREALRRDVDHVVTQIGLARSYVGLDQNEKALRILKAILSQHPGHQDAVRLLNTLTP